MNADEALDELRRAERNLDWAKFVRLTWWIINHTPPTVRKKCWRDGVIDADDKLEPAPPRDTP